MISGNYRSSICSSFKVCTRNDVIVEDQLNFYSRELI